MTLLFHLAKWHALAKLQMHTDPTLSHMDSVTTVLGQELQGFLKDTCSNFKMTELPKEYAAHGRWWCRKEAKNPVAAPSTSQVPTERKSKQLNLLIYKIHVLGDYVTTIRLFGTTDSFSTQIVSLVLVAIGYMLLLIHVQPGGTRASLCEVVP